MPKQAKGIETIQDLQEVLVALGYELKEANPPSKLKAVVLLDSKTNRVSELEKIATLIGGEYVRSVSGSSVGGTIIQTQAAKSKRFVVLAKPKSRQGLGSAGVGNEKLCIDNIRDILKNTGEPIDVILVDKQNRKFKASNVVDCVHVGTDTKGRKKADIILIGQKKNYPISLKQDNAGMWESADKYWRENALRTIEALQRSRKIKLKELAGKSGVYKIEPEVLVACTPEEIQDVVFGSDILPNGCIVKRTFSSPDFEYNGDKNTLTIQTSYLIRNMEEANDEMYVPKILLRNDSSRLSPKGIPGVRLIAMFGKRGAALNISLSERRKLGI